MYHVLTFLKTEIEKFGSRLDALEIRINNTINEVSGMKQINFKLKLL
jgi:tetrahydromethanopterin S-methyltransferase subunit G